LRVEPEKLAFFTWGADRVTLEGETAAFWRMPRPLQEHYADTESRRIRMRCSSGVRLALRTDARWMRLSVEYGAAARRLYGLDVFVDGARQTPAGTADESGQPWAGEVFRFADRRPRHVEVWMTHCAETRIRAVELDDGSRAEPAPRPPRTWLAIGDSITQGMTCRTPALTYAARAAAELGLDLRNVGVGGACMAPAVGRLCRFIPADVATVAFGTNDFNTSVPLEAFADRAREVIEGLTEERPGFPIGLITPTPWVGGKPVNEVAATLENYRRVLADVAGAYPSVRLVEGPTLVPDRAELFVDGVHPNDEGMAAYAVNLTPHLRRLLRG
jgi:lysophospholipase L1-like esterase